MTDEEEQLAQLGATKQPLNQSEKNKVMGAFPKTERSDIDLNWQRTAHTIKIHLLKEMLSFNIITLTHCT